MALSASVFEEERGEVLEAGFDDFLAKPFREAALFEKLREHLGVRYRYEEEAAAAAAGGEGVAVAERLRGLPPELVAGLRDAVEAGDVEESSRIADGIASRDEGLAASLRELIRGYRFDELQRALDGG